MHLFCCTAALGAARLYDQTPESIEERVYKLHYNRGQNRTDTFALARLTSAQTPYLHAA